MELHGSTRTIPMLARRHDMLAKFVGIAPILVLVAGCASISYKPSLSLGPSPVTIHRKVQVDSFRDESPPRDKGRKVGGTSATEPGTMAGELGAEVTNAVLTDFNNNAVFETIRARVEDPDLIMRGTIRRFYGHAAPNAL